MPARAETAAGPDAKREAAARAEPLLDLATLKEVFLSSVLLGGVIAMLTWPLSGLTPGYGVDPSWIAGLYMGTAQGLDAGTEIVFPYGPVGFLHAPNFFDVWLGRIAFLWYGAVHFSFCICLLWASRRAFGLLAGLAITLLATALPNTDPILIVAAVAGAAALLGDWTPRARLAFAVGGGAVAGVQLLGSLRAGPTLVAMGAAVLLGLPERKRNFIAFGASLLGVFATLWLATGQGLGNLDDYALNAADVVGGYSAAMVFTEPQDWWAPLTFLGSLAGVAALCAAAAWRRDNMRRIGLVLMVAAVVFVTYKHSIVRSSPGNTSLYVAAMLVIGLALVPHVRRSIAIGAIVVLAGFAYLGNRDFLDPRLEFSQHARSFGEQVTMVVTPGRAEDEQELGREAMKALYALSDEELALLRSGTVHVAPWEAGVAWAYDLDWDPLPVFQQYAAYTERLDELNAAKLEGDSAPELILWQNAPVVDPGFAAAVNFPGAIDAKWPAFESPAQMVRMLCRYRTVRWSERWAFLRRSADRCGPERQLGTVEAANGEAVPLPRTRPGEALVVRVGGLAVDGAERLRTLFFRATNRHVRFGAANWNVVGDTAADGLLLRVPRAADFPGPFALDSGVAEVAFDQAPGFLTGVDDSTRLSLSFSALPVEPARHR